MYHVHIYERNVQLGGPLTGGYSYQTTTTATDIWLSVPTTGLLTNYGWTVTPMSPGHYCNPSLQGVDVPFVVNGGAVGTQQIAKEELNTTYLS